MRGNGHNKLGRGHGGRPGRNHKHSPKKPSISTILHQASKDDSAASSEIFYDEFIQLFYQTAAIEFTEIAMIVRGHPVPQVPDNPMFMNGNAAHARQHNEEARAMIKVLTEKREARPRLQS